VYIKMNDEVNLYVKQSGKGLPCIFIHGGPGEGSLDFEILGGNVLEQYMQITYFDQRGSARSEGASTDDYSIERLTADIEEIREKLGIPKWIVMAHSFGGIIAANYVHKYQNYVHKLILLNATLSMEDSFISQIVYGTILLNEKNSPEKCNYDLEKWQSIVSKLLEKDIFYKLQYEDYNNFVKLNEVSNGIENFNANMSKQAFNNKEYFKSYFELTKEITVPVLVITGNEDYAIGPNHYKNFMFPNEEIKVIHGKHMLYLENNEEFKAAVREFIK